MKLLQNLLTALMVPIFEMFVLKQECLLFVMKEIMLYKKILWKLQEK